ncbi:MAG TPA: DUF2231 domain-containing protein [Gemmatimonadales bacterium]|nr:DUF2231 domain-containing protein [Gemmatimonadales bacterium]
MYDAARLHAALNDLPAALLVVAVLFDLAAWLRRRESLAWAGLWTLWAGVVGGWAAVVAGNLAEESIEHGEAIHELMERHELLGYVTMGIFTVVLGWKLWRRVGRRAAEEWVLRALSIVGLGTLLLAANVGGQLVFDHAAGVSSEKLRDELIDRGVLLPQADSAAPPPSGAHQHAPGTPPHEH